jgi:hypothetical protein
LPLETCSVECHIRLAFEDIDSEIVMSAHAGALEVYPVCFRTVDSPAAAAGLARPMTCGGHDGRDRPPRGAFADRTRTTSRKRRIPYSGGTPRRLCGIEEAHRPTTRLCHASSAGPEPGADFPPETIADMEACSSRCPPPALKKF